MNAKQLSSLLARENKVWVTGSFYTLWVSGGAGRVRLAEREAYERSLGVKSISNICFFLSSGSKPLTH